MAYSLENSIDVLELARLLEIEIIGTKQEIHSVSSFKECGQGVLSFVSKSDMQIPSNSIVIGPPGLVSYGEFTYLVSMNPRLDFIKSIQYFDTIGLFSKVVPETTIPPSAKIGRNVVIEPGCTIGEGVTIEHNAVIHVGSRIGDNSRIRANASIGGDGFGFERDTDGQLIRFPHLGGVTIGKNVEVGSNTCIARGTLGDTVIEDSVKIDNLVHIAHNCFIGSGSLITACAELSGGVTLGRDSWIGPNASILQKVDIGEASLVGMGAVVTRNVGNATIVYGNPARQNPAKRLSE